MHALRRFIQNEMDERGWQAKDLVKASGLSKQLVSQLLNDDREVLPQLPKTDTLAAIARAFSGLSLGHVTTIAVQALGVPDVQPPIVVHEISKATDTELLLELLARTERRKGGGERDQRSSAPITAALTRELHHAELDLAEWEASMTETDGARKQREILRAKVDELRNELRRQTKVETERDVSDSSGAESAL